MAVDRTVILACALGAVILILAPATLVTPASRSIYVAQWRPALVTLLIGLILLEAYVIGYTIAVEKGAEESRGQYGLPDLVRKCPPFTSSIDSSACSVAESTDTKAELQPGKVYTMSRNVFSTAPNGQSVAAGLMHDRAPGMYSRSRLSPTSEKETRDACCSANDKLPFTDLGVLCPQSEQLGCSAPRV